MKKIKHLFTAICALIICLPRALYAQSAGAKLGGLHGILEDLHADMLPLCSKLISVASGIAGFAALFYIGSRVWRHLASAEPIDFYPLFRPFVLGFCILNFPLVLSLIGGLMDPIVAGTAAMAGESNAAIERLLKEKQQRLEQSDTWQMYVGSSGEGDRDKWLEYTYDEQDAGEGIFESIGNDIRFAMEKTGYSFRNSIKEWLGTILEILFQAASLCINTLRTFQLIVLAILGPLVFGLAVFDGFQHILNVWLARYINVSLWLPIANIFGSIIGRVQEKMIELDLQQIAQSGYTSMFTSTDVAYMVFLIMGILGYSTVPSVANSVINAAGSSSLQQKVTKSFNSGLAALAGIRK